MLKTILRPLCAGALFAIAAATPSFATTITTSGFLETAGAEDHDLFNFEVTTESYVTMLLAGTTDAYLILFSGTNVFTAATYITQDDDTGGSLDSLIGSTLAAGQYTAWITSHGSEWTTTGFYYDHDHNPMEYTLSITGEVVASTLPAVPLPAGGPLLAAGLGLLAAGARRKKRATK